MAQEMRRKGSSDWLLLGLPEGDSDEGGRTGVHSTDMYLSSLSVDGPPSFPATACKRHTAAELLSL